MPAFFMSTILVCPYRREEKKMRTEKQIQLLRRVTRLRDFLSGCYFVTNSNITPGWIAQIILYSALGDRIFVSRQEMLGRLDAVVRGLTYLFPEDKCFVQAIAISQGRLDRITEEVSDELSGESEPLIRYQLVPNECYKAHLNPIDLWGIS